MPSQHAQNVAAAAPRPTEEFDAPPAAVSLQAPKRWNSQTLFGTDREVEIEHAGQLYRLRQTALGKLILTK